MKVDKEAEIPRDILLYDPEVLEGVNEEFGPATEIKHNIRTSAKIYEIRTALRYWFGGSSDHRTSDVIWMYCESVEKGTLELVDDELVWPDGEKV
jgi:hypothetical protein